MDKISSLFSALNTAWFKTSDTSKTTRKIDGVGKENEEVKITDSDSTSVSTNVLGN